MTPDESSGYFVDTLLRGQASAPTGTPQVSATESNSVSDRNSQGEVARILAHSIASGTLSAPDKQYLGQIVAARTGLSPAEAEQRVDTTYAAMTQSINDAKAKAKEAADQARKATAGLSVWMFISLLCGAFFGSLSATFGGRRRDLY